MKKKIIVTFLFCLVTANVMFAQAKDDKKADFEKFKAKRVEAISQAMNLTEKESTAFWPLCDELQMKKFELNKQLREEYKKIRKAKKAKETITDAQYKKVLELSVLTKMKEAELEQEYLNKFLEVISAEKVYLYKKAEQKFAKEKFSKESMPSRKKHK